MKPLKYVLALTLFAALALPGFTAGGDRPVPVHDEGARVMTFVPDKNHSQVGFKIRHLGISNVRGTFSGYDATVRLDPVDLRTLRVEATVDVASIDTENERRDNHLRSDDFFNAEQFPAMRFVSKEVRNIEGAAFALVADLTIRDVTKEVVFQGEFLGTGMQRGRLKAGFTAEATINRFDYNLKWDRLTEAGGLVAGEDVQILLEMELEEVEDQTGKAG